MKVTWWGHATATVTVDGLRVLTDPVLTDRVAHLRRTAGASPTADAVRADVVVVSHLHADHLHLPSLRRLPPGTRVVAPRGGAALVAARVPALAASVTEVTEGDTVRVGSVRVTAVHAHHDGRRLPVSRHRGPALGYVLAGDEGSAWFAGDTGLFDAMSTLGPVDLAVVPVGGWGPTLGPHHLDPDQAVEAATRVGAAAAVPVHYGTFWPLGMRHLGLPKGAHHSFEQLFTEPGRRFAAAARRTAPALRVRVLGQGATWDLQAAGPPPSGAPGPATGEAGR